MICVINCDLSEAVLSLFHAKEQKPVSWPLITWLTLDRAEDKKEPESQGLVKRD